MHVFDHKNWKKLESEERKKMQPVEPLIDQIDKIVAKKDVAFDIGSGTGYYTIPLSRLFKKVYAVEVNEKMVELLVKRLRKGEVKNVGIIVAEKPPDVDFEIDFVLFANVLHEMEENLRRRYLKWASNATICVVDWKKDSNFGPPRHVKIDESEIIRILEGMGLFTKKLDVYKHHYVIFGLKVRVLKRKIF